MWSLPGVDLDVVSEVLHVPVALSTVTAGVGLAILQMQQAPVPQQACQTREAQATLHALERLFARVDRLVLCKAPFPREAFLADWTDERLLTSVFSLVRPNVHPSVARVRAVRAAVLSQGPACMAVP